MYRILPKKTIFIAFAWLVVGLALFAWPTVEVLLQQELRWAAIPAVAWIVLSSIAANPVWRFLWRVCPSLNQWFPDLNGDWEVELFSNWPRQEQLLTAAASKREMFDMRHAPEAELAPMTSIILSARITQTWWSIEMKMTNPKNDTPIESSETLFVEPIARKGIYPAGICYFYKQTNDTDNVSDNTEFYGAARLNYDAENDQLCGTAWTARMWRRAMNTAGKVTFTRLENKK